MYIEEGLSAKIFSESEKKTWKRVPIIAFGLSSDVDLSQSNLKVAFKTRKVFSQFISYFRDVFHEKTYIFIIFLSYVDNRSWKFAKKIHVVKFEADEEIASITRLKRAASLERFSHKFAELEEELKEIQLKFIVSLTDKLIFLHIKYSQSEKNETHFCCSLWIMLSMMQKNAVLVINGANILCALKKAYNPISPAWYGLYWT